MVEYSDVLQVSAFVPVSLDEVFASSPGFDLIDVAWAKADEIGEADTGMGDVKIKTESISEKQISASVVLYNFLSNGKNQLNGKFSVPICQ